MQFYLSHAQVRERAGMVVPVYFPVDAPREQMRDLLRLTTADSERFVRPERLVLVVDGAPHAVAPAQEVAAEFAARAGAPFQVRVLERNGGKGAAVLAGLEMMPPGTFVAIRDGDADHVIDDLPHLLRLAVQMDAETGGTPVAVIGRRTGPHAPLGWLRGELELLVDEIVLEAIRFALAREGRAPALQYCHAQLPPDFESGYKVFSPAAVPVVIEGFRRAAAQSPELDMLRWGVEMVPMVEVALAGGLFGEAHRATLHEQPVTSYGKGDQAMPYARRAIWPLRRCSAPGPAARQIVDNALARRLLETDPEGRACLRRFRSLVLEALGAEDAPLRAPLFL